MNPASSELSRELCEQYRRFLERRRCASSDPAFVNGILGTLLHGVVPAAEKLERVLCELQGEAPVALIDEFRARLEAQRGNMTAAHAKRLPEPAKPGSLSRQRASGNAKRTGLPARA